MSKKNFKDNPALQFISTPAEDRQAPAAPTAPPPGFKIVYEETKSRRLQLLLQPSLYRKIREAAEAAGISVNEYCHQALEIATRKENEQ